MTVHVMLQEHVLAGRIVDLTVMTVREFGMRTSFRLDCAGQRSVACCVADDVAPEFIALYREGDMATVSGTYETRPSTASANTPWAGRFRIHAPRRVAAAQASFPQQYAPAHS
jgi:hypothetical protein